MGEGGGEGGGEKGMLSAVKYERDPMGRIIVEDGCIRGSPSHIKNHSDLLFPEEANVKDPGEHLLEDGEWRKNDMFFEYRIKEGEELRLKGNEQFKQGKYAEAAVLYRKGLYYAVFDDSQFQFELQDEHRDSVVKTVVPLRLNYALCLLKDDYRPLRKPLPDLEERFSEAIEHCNEVLNWFKAQQEGLNPADHAKALFRKGCARVRMGNLELAKSDLKDALKLEPNNKDVRRELERVKALEKEDLARQKKLWSGAVAVMAHENESERQREEEAEEKEEAGGGGGETAEEKRAEIKRMLEELERQDQEASHVGFWGGLKKLVGWG